MLEHECQTNQSFTWSLYLDFLCFDLAECTFTIPEGNRAGFSVDCELVGIHSWCFDLASCHEDFDAAQLGCAEICRQH